MLAVSHTIQIKQRFTIKPYSRNENVYWYFWSSCRHPWKSVTISIVCALTHLVKRSWLRGFVVLKLNYIARYWHCQRDRCASRNSTTLHASAHQFDCVSNITSILTWLCLVDRSRRFIHKTDKNGSSLVRFQLVQRVLCFSGDTGYYNTIILSYISCGHEIWLSLSFLLMLDSQSKHLQSIKQGQSSP